jgi:hypothetical protein
MNGTRINGRLVTSGRLHPGDELSIAHLRYRLDGSAAALAAGDVETRGSGAADLDQSLSADSVPRIDDSSVV